MENQNNFKQNIRNLKRSQENQYNPKLYTGTGRGKRPIINLSKYPVWMIIAGVLGLISQIITLFISSTPIKEVLFPFFVSVVFLIGGILCFKRK